MRFRFVNSHTNIPTHKKAQGTLSEKKLNPLEKTDRFVEQRKLKLVITRVTNKCQSSIAVRN